MPVTSQYSRLEVRTNINREVLEYFGDFMAVLTKDHCCYRELSRINIYPSFIIRRKRTSICQEYVSFERWKDNVVQISVRDTSAESYRGFLISQGLIKG